MKTTWVESESILKIFFSESKNNTLEVRDRIYICALVLQSLIDEFKYFIKGLPALFPPV